MTDSDGDGPRHAVLLDVFPNGRSEGRGGRGGDPIAYGLGEADFLLYELGLTDDADVGFADRVVVSPADERTAVDRVTEIEYGDLSGGAQSELEYAVEDVIEADEGRFVDFYNDAQPITLRLHQLNLLPGIGKKLRNAILDERKRSRFGSFDDLEDRVAGLHDPKEILAERILEEIRDDDLKYRAFVGRAADE